MRLSQYIERKPEKRRKSRAAPKRAANSITMHPSYVPMVTVWGAALAGLAVSVQPAVIIARISMIANLGFLGDGARWLYIAVAALIGAGLAWAVARALRARTLEQDDTITVVAAVKKRRVQPIDPASELGSESLDAPIDETPFGADADEEHEGEEAEEPLDLTDEAMEPEDAPTPERQPTLGELARRGYEMEAPEADDDALAKSKGDDEWVFTRRHFGPALIETCEGATCEAEEAASATPHEPEQTEPNAHEEAPAEPEQEEEDMAQVMTSEDQPAAGRRISAAATAQAWSLTQFAPPKKSPATIPPAHKAQAGVDGPRADERADEHAPRSPLAQKPARTASGGSARTPADALTPSEPRDPAPRELDLAEFAALPGRNAVWVSDDTAPPPAAGPLPARSNSSAPTTREAPVPASALEKLRQKSPDELSLVEMVERFAAALHERQVAERARLPQSGPTRDAALAEALKALTLFTERGFDEAQPNQSAPAELGETERELRDALSKLQTLRGAA